MLRNRNCNFITDLSGTRIVIKWNPKSSHRHSTIQNCVFYFLHLKFFSFTFYDELDDTYQILPCKIAYYVKRQDFFFNLENCAEYGAGTGTITCRKSEPVKNKVNFRPKAVESNGSRFQDKTAYLTKFAPPLCR